jgi:hypothetical protein
MPAQRSAMRKIREVLRLKFEVKLSHDLHSADPVGHFGVISSRGRGDRRYFVALSSIKCRV